MSEQRFRVLFVVSHPIQYQSPLFRRFAAHPELDVHVAYCSLRGVEAAHDPDFNIVVQWDIPLLSGYNWSQIVNKGSGGASFLGLCNPGLWRVIRRGRYDAVVCFVGYMCLTFWITAIAAKMSRTAFLFGTDATTLVPRSGRSWKRTVKRMLWPALFRIADQVIVPSSGTQDLMLAMGLPPDRVSLTPYTVDNDWWAQESRKVDRFAVRRSWGASPEDTVVLFSGKLQAWKRPLDLLRAFSKAGLANALLVFAGEGPLKLDIETEAKRLGIDSRVRLLGFVNQSVLPSVYTASDLMVLPSEYEPFAVVVNEAMCCGCPVVVSDRVGAARDLVVPVRPEFVYHCGHIEALANLLRDATSNSALLQAVRRDSVARMRAWSPEKNIAATVTAIRTAVSRLNLSRPKRPSSKDEAD